MTRAGDLALWDGPTGTADNGPLTDHGGVVIARAEDAIREHGAAVAAHARRVIGDAPDLGDVLAMLGVAE